MAYITNLANVNNYTNTKRSLKSIKYLVIHYTGGKGDTVRNNLSHFHNHNAGASAHLFVDSKDWGKSVKLVYPAWSVGKDYRSGLPNEARYYGKCTNANSVSIEICDFNSLLDLDDGKLKNLRKAIKYVFKWCPNCKYVIRHFDVNGKECPAPLITEEKWNEFLTLVLRGL